MNRSDAAAFAARGAVVIEGLHGDTIRIGGIDYPAAVGTPPLEGSSQLGGETFEGELLIQVRKTVLLEKPALKTKVRTKGRDWVVIRASGNDVDAVWTLRLEPPN